MTTALPWFRFYSEFVHDEIIEFLSFEDQRHYVFLLCLKAMGLLDKPYPKAGMLDAVVGRKLGLQGEALTNMKIRLREVGLINENWQPLAWDKRQFTSDSSAERTRKYRIRKGLLSCDGDETSHERHSDALDTDTDTDTDTDKTTKVEDVDIQIAQQMLQDIRAINPSYKGPTRIEKWANSIRLIRVRDRRTPDDIRALWSWANNHHFWRTNILSPDKLRQQWDRLTTQRIGEQANETRKRPDNSAVGRVDAANERWARQQR